MSEVRVGREGEEEEEEGEREEEEANGKQRTGSV